MHNQVHNTSQMVGQLREELERRLKDVMQMREERDDLQVTYYSETVCYHYSCLYTARAFWSAFLDCGGSKRNTIYVIFYCNMLAV